MNKYWIPNLDIHKKVITAELPYYLGPEATVRPFTKDVRERCLPADRLPLLCGCGCAHTGTLQGEDGFLITTPGPCLSDVSLAFPARSMDFPCSRVK